MKYLKIFVSSIFAGLCIALGATVYLSMLAINQKFIGSLLFGVGLFTIISFGLWLYTGKIGFVINEKPMGNEIWEQKIRFFYEFEELVEIKNNIRKRLSSLEIAA